MRRILAILIALFCGLQQTYAQNYNVGYDPESNGSRSSILTNGKTDGTYANDFFTGIGRVNIPLFNEAVDGVDVSVSLNYSTKGIRVDDMAGDIGLGWNLMAGGYIDRIVHGLPDELYVLNTGNEQMAGSWMDYKNTSPSELIDSESDLFTATFAGKSFQFTIDFTVPKQLNSMKPTISGNDKYTIFLCKNDGSFFDNWNWPAYTSAAHYGGNDHSFYIRDAQGNQFLFTVKNDKETRWTHYVNKDLTHEYTANVTERWWLTKIITRTGKEITYSYHFSGLPQIDIPLYTEESVVEKENNPIFGPNELDLPALYPSKLSYSKKEIKWKGYMHKPWKIQLPDNKEITFEYKNIARCDLAPFTQPLDKIVLTQGFDNDVKTVIAYQFNQAYFHSDNGEVPLSDPCGTDADKKTRIKLLGINRIINNSTTEQVYTFGYDPVKLPERFSPATDFYGYFNAATIYSFNDGGVLRYYGVPYHESMLINNQRQTYGMSKTPDLTFTKACLLNSVKNSMGGEYKMYYKAHELTDHSNPSDFISELTQNSSNTGDGVCLDKVEYTDGFNPDNNWRKRYVYSGGAIFFKHLYFYYPITFYGSTCVERRWSSHSNTPIDYYNGSNHGYSYVTEIIENTNTGEQVSKTEYHFSNIVHETNGQLRMSDYKLTEKEVVFPAYLFKKSEIGLPLDIKKYVGSTLVSRTDNTYANVTKANYTNNTFFRYTQCDPSYQPSFPYTFRIAYSHLDYFLRRLTSSKQTTYSGAASIEQLTTYSYSGLYNVSEIKTTNSSGETFTKELTYLVSPFFEDTYQETTSLWKGITPNRQLLQHSVSTPDNANLPKNFYKSSSSKLSQPVASIANANVTDDLEITRYDAKNNPTETKVDGQKYSAAIYDTRMGYKLAEVSNARYSQIAYTSFEGLAASVSASLEDKGNWTFDQSQVTRSQAFTGKYSYSLISNKPIESNNIIGDYVLTFWSTLLPTLYVGGNDVTSLLHAVKSGAGGWTLYTVKLSLTNEKVQLRYRLGTTYIDEVRLHPVNASMVTYTYNPLLGLLSANDPRNNVVFTEYDNYGRPVRTKNTKGFILKETLTTILGSDN